MKVLKAFVAEIICWFGLWYIAIYFMLRLCRPGAGTAGLIGTTFIGVVSWVLLKSFGKQTGWGVGLVALVLACAFIFKFPLWTGHELAVALRQIRQGHA